MRRIIVSVVLLIGGLLVTVAPVAAASAPSTTISPSSMRLSPIALEPALTRARAKPRWQVTVRGWSQPVRRGGQATIDKCKATLFWGSLPGNSEHPAWLAGHDRCGFWRWDKWLPVGSKFKVTTPQGKVLKYQVYGRDIINRKSGKSDGLIHGDITLQTCRGSHMTFAHARRTR